MIYRRLLQLLDANRGRGAGVKIINGDPDSDEDEDRAGVSDTATIYVYDAIGSWDGVQAGEMVKSIAAIDKSNIHVRINSPGGDVFDARAIKTALEQHSAKVTAYVDGVAASAASFLMLAADEIQIAPGAFVMIHNPWGFAMGDAKEMRATAALLDQVGGAIRNDYATRTGLDAATLTQMMDDETWLSAEEAVDKKFCDALMAKPAKASASAKGFDLSAYANAPKELAARVNAEAELSAALEASRVRQEQKLRIYKVA
jgi:ATP-dependent Clp protease protease subunit